MAIIRSSTAPARGAAGTSSSNGSDSRTMSEREQLLASVLPASNGNREAIRFLREHAEKSVIPYLQGEDFKARLLNTIKATNIALGSPETLADELLGFAVQELKTTDHYMLLVAPPENVGSAVLKLAGMGVPVCRDAGQGFLSVRVAKSGEIQVAGIPQIPAYQRMVRQIACKMIGWKPGDQAPEINTKEWRSQDPFSYKVQNGKPQLTHEVNVRPDGTKPNEIEGAYCVITVPKQSPFVVVLQMDQILTLLGQTVPAPTPKDQKTEEGAPAGEGKKQASAGEETSGKKRFYARVPEKEWTNAVLRVACREWMSKRAVLNPEASLLAGALLREESVHEHEKTTGERIQARPTSINLLVGAKPANGAAMLGAATPAPQTGDASPDVAATAASKAEPEASENSAGGSDVAAADAATLSESAPAAVSVTTPTSESSSITPATPAGAEAASTSASNDVPQTAGATESATPAKGNRGRRPAPGASDEPVVFTLRQPAGGSPRL